MEKIKEITIEQFEALREMDKDEIIDFLKELVEADENLYFGLGNTCIRANNVKTLEVYKEIFKGFITYRLIVEVLDENTAFSWSLYQKI